MSAGMGNKPIKKLQIKKETLRKLMDTDLTKAAGGQYGSINCSTMQNTKCCNSSNPCSYVP